MSDEAQLPIKIPEDVLSGVYANQMVVRHTQDEFVLDFIHLAPPEGIVNARVIVGPRHLKRIVEALAENLSRYEARFGAVTAAEAPRPAPLKN